MLTHVSQWLGFCQAFKEIWSPAMMLSPALPLYKYGYRLYKFPAIFKTEIKEEIAFHKTNSFFNLLKAQTW